MNHSLPFELQLDAYILYDFQVKAPDPNEEVSKKLWKIKKMIISVKEEQ